MQIKMRLIFAAICVGCLAFKSSLAFPQPLNIAHSLSSSVKVLKSKVKLVPAQNTDKDPVYGILSLVETSEGVYIQGKILGLEPGKHGFHVHAIGDLGNDCKSAGGHFNPEELDHGQPQNEANRHVGDLGNIVSPEDDFTSVNILDTLVTLQKGQVNDINGRAFVVHATEDDLGLGGNPESLKTGNAGKRLACGIVEPIIQ